MDFNPSDEQKLLIDSAERFVRNECTLEKRLSVLKENQPFSPQNWKNMADMGWLMLTVPEVHGGLEASMADTTRLMQTLGRGVVLEPIITSAVWSASFLGSIDVFPGQQKYLESLMDGSKLFAVAHTESFTLTDSTAVTCKAIMQGEEYVLNGSKSMVLDGASADYLLVTAMLEHEQFGVFLVEADEDNINRNVYPLIDGSQACDVTFDNCFLSADSLIAKGDSAWELLQLAIDKAHLSTIAEMVGLMDACLDVVSDYVKNRQQFGQAIGQFQSLQHIMADMFVAVQEAHSVLFYALSSIDETITHERQRALSMAQLVVSASLKFVTEQGIQLHGGYGVTDEYEISHFYKRAMTRQFIFGDEDFHVKRAATLHQSI